MLGIGDDALVLPQGVFRFRTLGNWTWFNERYGKDTPGRPDGALEPLGQLAKVDLAHANRCDFISAEGTECLFPWPNDYFTVPDRHSETGRRVNNMSACRCGIRSIGVGAFSTGFSMPIQSYSL